MARSALPTVVLCLEDYILGAATGATNAIRPAPRYQKFPAIFGVGKMYNGFLKSAWFHALILAENG
jgi:hypothetical protein